MHLMMPARPVQALLRPRAIALVGVSPKGGAGARILESNARFDRLVPTWPVNPHHREIAGQRCYGSLKELPEVPDCVVISVPAEAVLDVIGEAAAAGIRGAFVISEGFADADSDAGRALQERLVGFARAANMALAGPNCMGIASLHYGFAATMADVPARATSGGISLVSQSGGLLNAFAELAGNRGIGVNYLVSSGNEAGLEMADYIAYLADDPATRVIACIMEGAKNGRRFRAAVEAAVRRKPMVVLKLGRSEFGQRATLAHTGTLAGRHEAFGALFRQNGVALVDSIDALAQTAALFDLAPLPQGDRVVMMTVSGGATSLIGDLGDAAGINFPPIRGGHQQQGAEDPRRRARLRQSARYRRSAAAAPGRQHHGGAAGAVGRRRTSTSSASCSACGRTAGSRIRIWSIGWRRRRARPTSRCCSSPSCPTA